MVVQPAGDKKSTQTSDLDLGIYIGIRAIVQ